MNRRLVSVLALSVAAFVAVAGAHPDRASAAKAPAAAASPSPNPSPSATPEPLDKAIPRLEAALKAHPDDKASQVELAGDYLQINRPDLTLPLTQRLLAGGTKTAQVYYYDGVAQGGLGHAKESLADLENAANLEPTNAGVLGMLTNAYLSGNRPQDAERVAKRAVTFNKDDENSIMTYGSVLEAENKFDEARAQFENAAKANPKDARPVLAEADTYLRQNAIALAAPLYDRAIAIDPTSLPALAGKARLQGIQHDVPGAIASYNKVLALQTDPADKVAVLDQEAVLYASEKMNANADAMYKRAIAEYPNVFTAHTAYADYLVSISDRAGAERELIAGSGPNHDQSDAIARLGQLYASENQLPKAIEQFKRLGELQPNDPRAHLLIAASYAANHQFDKARNEYKASYTLQHTPDALIGLGQSDLQTRNYAECTQVYEALDRGAPDLSRQNPTILYGLGQCYQKSNQPAKARTAYVKLLGNIKPGTQAANQVKALIDGIDRSGKSTPKAAPKKK